MPASQTQDWFGIRTIYHFGTKPDGTNVFEERVCVFSGKTDAEAFKKAQKEADDYTRAGRFICHPVQEAYRLDGDSLIDGYEVWSELFDFKGSLAEFVQERYGRFAYQVDLPLKFAFKRKTKAKRR